MCFKLSRLRVPWLGWTWTNSPSVIQDNQPGRKDHTEATSGYSRFVFQNIFGAAAVLTRYIAVVTSDRIPSNFPLSALNSSVWIDFLWLLTVTVGNSKTESLVRAMHKVRIMIRCWMFVLKVLNSIFITYLLSLNGSKHGDVWASSLQLTVLTRLEGHTRHLGHSVA